MWDDGELQGSVATFFDITERLHMQAALRQGEVRMTGLVDAVNDGVITIDAEGKVVLFNRAAERLFGAPATEAIGSTVDRFIPRHPRSPEAARMQELQIGDVDSGEVRELFGRRADGQEFPLEVSLSRHETERGPLLTAVLRDVTGLQTARAERQAREALEASSRAKTEFLSRMSHELRTPLNAVLGFSQLLRLDNAEPPSLQQLARIQHIENAGAHLLALVNDVLDLSRVESGQMTVTLESVDLRSSVEDALTMVLPLAASVGVKTWISGARGRPAVPGRVGGRRHLRPRRPRPPAPGAGQPAQQRRQVQPARRPGAGDAGRSTTSAAPCASPTTASAWRRKSSSACSSRSTASAPRTRRSRAPASAWCCRGGWSS